MEQQIKQDILRSVSGLQLPAYENIPTVGLFLDQTAKYISEYLNPLLDTALTGSMISNYVKRKLIPNPVKKQYGREQIAYLFFIAVAKQVLSLEEIQWLITIQKQAYDLERAYRYFCQELQNVVFYVYGVRDSLETIGVDETDEKMLLRSTIIAVAHRAYLSSCLAALRKAEQPGDPQEEAD